MEANSLRCSCVIEYLDECGQVLRKHSMKTAILDLGRNQLGDVVLRVSHDEGSVGPLTIRQHVIHRRFLRDGKATIRLITQKVQLLVSNCPPVQLRQFLHNVALKVAARGRLQGAKEGMLPDVSLGFDDISPLNERDLEMAAENCRKALPKSMTTPKRSEAGSKAPKRKLSDISNVLLTRGTQPTSSVCSVEENSDTNPAKRHRAATVLRTVTSSLSSEQSSVLDMVKNGHNVFFTGSAGTGKSYLLKQIIGAMPPETTFATASTGSAACHIGGTTLHAFAGIGTGGGAVQQCIQLASREHKAAQWRKCCCLIIDEISMIDADYFDKLEAVARAVRKSKQPFGGIQLVLCGDFLQLPPVTKEGERKYCFQVYKHS